jgi:hypothetical protein
MSAVGAIRKRSWQKPRFLPAVNGVMSAEIAAGNFSQIKAHAQRYCSWVTFR